jgi:hypothetical protein
MRGHSINTFNYAQSAAGNPTIGDIATHLTDSFVTLIYLITGFAYVGGTALFLAP